MGTFRIPGTYAPQGDTRLLADVMTRLGLVKGRRVLDLCTGTGAVAIAAARQGAAAVTAVDLSTRAVLSARANAWRAGLPIDVRQGDLFEPVRGSLFDVVLVNPPYVPARSERLPRHTRGRSWDAGPDGRALVDRICHGVAAVLAADGVLLLAQSAVTNTDRTISALSSAGLDACVVGRCSVAFGPVMTRRAAWLAEQGFIEPGQQREDLAVIAASPARAAVARGGDIDLLVG